MVSSVVASVAPARERPGHLRVVDEPQFAPFPAAVLTDTRLSTGARLLYAVMQLHWWQGGECWASHSTMAAQVGCKERMIRYYIRELVALGYITERRRGRGQAKAYAPAQAATDCQLNRQEIAASEPKRQQIAVQAAKDCQFNRQQIADRSRSNEVDPPEEVDTGVVGAVGATPTPAGVRQSDVLRGLTPEAREILDWHRECHGRTRPAKLNPTQAAQLEEAVADLGVERLRESVRFMAGRGVPELSKAINAGRTKRKLDEEGAAAPSQKPSAPKSQLGGSYGERRTLNVRKF